MSRFAVRQRIAGRSAWKQEGGGDTILCFGVAFILTGMGCMAYPESFVLSVAGLVCMLAGLLLAVCGTVRKGKR